MVTNFPTFTISYEVKCKESSDILATETLLGLLGVEEWPLFDSPTIVTRCCASISLATLSPFLPPTRPHASSSSLFWHWADLQPEDSERGTEDWRKPRGGRKHESKELEKARGREHVWEGWARERKRQTVKQWSGCSCYHQGNEGRSAETWRESERERVSPY